MRVLNAHIDLDEVICQSIIADFNTSFALILMFMDARTFRTVPSSGLPVVLSARYRLSRLTPASCAICFIPLARATTPMASLMKATSCVSKASDKCKNWC